MRIFAALLVSICSISALAQDARVSGVVVKDDGWSVGAAEVNLLRRGQRLYQAVPRKVKTAADGQFAFDGVADGDWRIWAVSGNLTSRDKRFGDTIKVARARPIEPLKLTMRSGRIVTATIVSADDGKPVAGAFVRMSRSDIGLDFKADAQGHVIIEGLSPEEWELEAMAPGRAKVSKLVNLTDATDSAVDFALSPGGSIRGKVTDQAGKPLKGVGGNVYPNNRGMPTDYLETDADGNFLFDHLELDIPQRILFYADSWETVTIAKASPQAELNVKLSPKPARAVRSLERSWMPMASRSPAPKSSQEPAPAQKLPPPTPAARIGSTAS